MNRMTRVLSCLALLVACAAARSADNEVYQGSIRKIESTKIVLTTQAKDLTFQIDSATQISLDDKPAKVTDLKAGNEAKITAASRVAFPGKNEAPLAIRIDAHRGNSPGNPDPPEGER